MSRAPIELMPVLEEVFRTWWRDFAPIMLLGIALLLVPGTILALLVPAGGNGAVASTLSAMFTLMFMSAVSASTLVGYRGPAPLAPRAYFELGLRGLQPGLIAALTIAAGLVLVLIARLLLAELVGPSPLWWLLAVLLIAAATAAVAPAIAAAFAERLMPPSAIRRALQLTAGARFRVLGLLAALFVLMLPAAMLIRAVVFGMGASPEAAAERLAALTPGTAGYWILQLFNLLTTGILAVVPPILYRRLAEWQSPTEV